MKKTQYSEAQLNEIAAIVEQRNVTRKSAIRLFEKGKPLWRMYCETFCIGSLLLAEPILKIWRARIIAGSR
jgi:hypothetical protein